ncbi:kinase-like domain-containing protein [Mycena amicta]|nr:kinase-like domain-containing protein [Mycena amicta]
MANLIAKQRLYPCMISLGERCEACGSAINLLDTSPSGPHIDSLSLDITPFSESFSALIGGLDDENDTASNDRDLEDAYDDCGRTQHDADEMQLKQHEDLSYYVEQYSDVNELDPAWDDEDVQEIMILSPKQRRSKLPTISEEHDALSLASNEAHCSESIPQTGRPIALTDFDIIPTSEYPMLCRKRSTNEIYAIKALNPGLDLEKLVMETIRRVDAPFLERLQWSFSGVAEGEEGRIYLILDSKHRESLVSLVNAGPLSVADVQFYACELVDAISSLHNANIVHRDLTPFNVFVDDDGHILISNFCNAVILSKGPQVSPPSSSAIEYQSPEIFLGWTHNAVADCWSFGILLHFLLTGKNPVVCDGSDASTFDNQILSTEANLVHVVCPHARDLIQKCLERNPALRLCIGEIRDHVYFERVDWANVRGKNILPPNRSRTPSPKLQPLSEDFPLPPISRLSLGLDSTLDFSFTVQTASKAIPSVPRLERVDVRDTVSGITVGPRRPLFRIRSSCSMDDLRARSHQAKRWSLNIPSNSATRLPHHRSTRSIHDTGTSSLYPEPARLNLPPIFRPTPLDDCLVEEEEPSPAISSPTVCEPSPHQRMAEFWETIDAEGQQQETTGTSLELRDAMRLALPCPPLPRSGRRMRKRASMGLLGSQSDNRLSAVSTPPPSGNKLRKMRRPLSTPLLRKRSSDAILNLPLGVEQIGKGIGFTYKIPGANRSKASICTSSVAGRLLRSGLGIGKSILRKVKSTPGFSLSPKSSSSGLGGRRARGPPARIQTGAGRIVTPGLHSPAMSEGPLTPESAAFPPLPEIVGDPFAKDDPQTIGDMHMRGVRLVHVEQKLSSSPTMDNILFTSGDL